MTSSADPGHPAVSLCPDEHELVELVDDALPAPRAEEVVAHLVDCADCRALVARSEAALCYALGGTADAEFVYDEPVAHPRPLGRRRLGLVVAAAALLLCVSLAAQIHSTVRTRRWPGSPPASTAMTPPAASSSAAGTSMPAATDDAPPADARLANLLARCDALATPPPRDEDESLALAALGAAEARIAFDRLDAAEAHLVDLMRDFPQTAAARRASVRLRELSGK